MTDGPSRNRIGQGRHVAAVHQSPPGDRRLLERHRVEQQADLVAVIGKFRKSSETCPEEVERDSHVVAHVAGVVRQQPLVREFNQARLLSRFPHHRISAGLPGFDRTARDLNARFR